MGCLKKNAAELCAVLLKEIYGEVSSRVASVLLEYGRLNLQTLVRYSKLPEKIVKQTLVVLIQLHLVVHSTHKEGHRDEVYYECTWLQVYELLHAGKMIAMVEERFGTDGAYIISNMLQMGHVRVSDFLAGSGLSDNPKQAATNGTSNGVTDATKSAPTSLASLRAAMGDLLRSRYLIQVHEHHMHPQTDVINDVRAKITRQVKESHGAMSDLKLKKVVDAQLKSKLRELAVGDISENAGMKKRMAQVEVATSNKRPSKRAKLSNNFEDVSGKEAVWQIDENSVVRVNHEKFLILFRNKELVTMAERRLGKTTSLVFGQLLKALEDKIHRCQDTAGMEEEESDPKKKLKISTLELSRTFDKDIELGDTIAPLPKNTVNGKKRPNDFNDDDMGLNRANGTGNGDDEAEDDEDEERDEWAEDQEVNPETAAKKRRMAIIKDHLDLLAQDSYPFVKSEGNRGLGEWSVDFGALIKTMKQVEIEKIIEQRFGGVATRLLRILQEKGKLDEKQLATIALRKSTSIRSTLSALQEAGHLELQEVPKTADRAASRTIFLWYYDPDRARLNVLHDIYKAMSRTLQRIAHERSEVQPLLEKAERTDILGKEELYLSKAELRTIARFRVIEEKLLAQVGRLDRQVMIFRDY
ncbi:RNA polymerase III subunit RPC82-domain-containing protein [Kalaharituber pfeilii]|nr:RNA polymerase III subunit RPC82-domain-containing protein [Kalaharituber pfeilii]